MRLGTASWALDSETLLMMRAKSIKFVGVLVRETGDIYMTALENFFDKTKAKILNFESRGGAHQRYLPLQHFKLQLGATKLKTR